MKICVVGLGIIGGSLCLALKRAKYTVDGWNRNPLPLEYALTNGVIDGVATHFKNYDVVFLALPPKVTQNYLDGCEFGDGAIVTDVCGVKKSVEDIVLKRERNYRYVGCHPMAGKEVSGIEAACSDLFDGASMVITSNAATDDDALNVIRQLTKDMGFGRIVECSAEIHDKKIAYTSQLAHIVSNAYVKDDDIDCCLGFTGGSFQDMTRIAGVDENMWAALYLENSVNISEKIQKLISSLAEIKLAIDENDMQKLACILKNGRLLFENSKKINANSRILVKNLK